MNASAENQHWVPKFLVKNFRDTDGRVFCLNTQTGEVTKPPPKHAASSIGFNDFRIAGETVSFEDRLEKIETAAAPILRQIADMCSVTGLTAEQRHRLSDFMATQSFRTEAFSKGLDPELPREQFGAYFAELWRSAFLVSAEIAQRNWAVMKIEHDDIFYLGDNPVVLQNTEDPVSPRELGFDIGGTEAFLPVTPKCALYMPCTTVSEQIIAGYQSASEIVRSAGPTGATPEVDARALLRLSHKIVHESRDFYLALTTGTSYVVDHENVENLNYLQCMFAHKSLYSNRGDFSFARHVFDKTPQYRDTMRVHISTFKNTN